MIKSIVVKTKPFPFQIGDVLYSGSDKYQYKHVVTGPVHLDRSLGLDIWKVPVDSTKIGTAFINDPFLFGSFGSVRSEELYLGDEGAPGFTYDDRPCTIARSTIMATVQANRYTSWLTVRNNDRRSWF